MVKSEIKAGEKVSIKGVGEVVSLRVIPSEIKVGETALIELEMSKGDREASVSVGKMEYIEEVSLEPNGSKRVSFEVIPEEAGVYNVDVDGLTGSFTAIPVVPVTTLYGYVTDAKTGSPLEGAWAIISTITEPYEEVAHAITSADGTYRIEDIEPGRYWLIFMATGYREQVFEKALVEGDNEINIALTDTMAPPPPTDYLLMGKDELYSCLIDGSVSQDWWSLSYDDRRQLGLKIINWWSVEWFEVPDAFAFGEPGCAGGPPYTPWEEGRLLYPPPGGGMEHMSGLRYCLFTDHSIAPTNIYFWWSGRVEGIAEHWHCYNPGVSFSLPTAVAIGSADYLNCLQIGEDVSQLASWIFFGIDLNDIKPGGWRWKPVGWKIGICEVVGIHPLSAAVELGRRIVDIWDGGSTVY